MFLLNSYRIYNKYDPITLWKLYILSILSAKCLKICPILQVIVFFTILILLIIYIRHSNEIYTVRISIYI